MEGLPTGRRSRSGSFSRLRDKIPGLSRNNSPSDHGIHRVASIGAMLGVIGGLNGDGTRKSFETSHNDSLMILGLERRTSAVEESDKESVRRFFLAKGQSTEIGEVAGDNAEEDVEEPATSPISITVTPDNPEESETCADVSDELPDSDVFDYTTDDSITIATGEDVEENVLDIKTWSREGKELYMRALLDTGCEPNIITHEKARSTGRDIDRYDGESLINMDGRTYLPIGRVKLQWHFNNRWHEKVYNIDFLVVSDDTPYDVVIGSRFIFAVKLFKWNRHPHALIFASKKQSAEEKAAEEKRKQQQRERNERIKQEQKEKWKQDNSSSSAGDNQGTAKT